MMSRTLTPILAALMLSIAPMAHADLAKKKAPEAVAAPVVIQEKVVYHVNDSANARVAMNNVNNHLNATPGAKIVVVTHGKGIDFLLNDAKDDKGEFASVVSGLKAKGVDFRVCNNTLVGRKIDPATVNLEASIVPSGVAEIGRLQSKEGYAYLKP